MNKYLTDILEKDTERSLLAPRSKTDVVALKAQSMTATAMTLEEDMEDTGLTTSELVSSSASRSDSALDAGLLNQYGVADEEDLDASVAAISAKVDGKIPKAIAVKSKKHAASKDSAAMILAQVRPN